jgi:hypothetical protein
MKINAPKIGRNESEQTTNIRYYPSSNFDPRLRITVGHLAEGLVLAFLLGVVAAVLLLLQFGLI